MSVLIFPLQLFLGAICIMSALPKLFAPRIFVSNVLNYRVLPPALASAYGWSLPYTEIAAAKLPILRLARLPALVAGVAGALLVLAAIAALLWPYWTTKTPLTVDPLLKEAQARANALTGYSVLAEELVRYASGSESRLWWEMNLKLRDPEERKQYPGRTELDAMRMRTSEEGGSAPVYVGLWTSLDRAMEYLATAPAVQRVAETTFDGNEVVRLRAVFPERPDLDTYSSALPQNIPAQLMLERYGGIPVTVDAWVGKDDHLVRRIEMVSRGTSPHDKRGMVHERVITLTFSDFDRIHPDLLRDPPGPFIPTPPVK